ncbi:MAG TPA: O-antigen ligase family protein [Vicinamibacterales bacterium]|nr:O-antigen ligase family protein [Vicinamibacterales bacterium]
MLAWATLLAGGVYAWVWIPAGSLLLGLALATRPKVAVDERFRILDLTLIAILAACLVQIVPMPIQVLRAFDPRAITIRTTLWLPPILTPSSVRWIPISIAPGDTLAACGIFLSALLMFWTCRRVCAEGGTGHIVRAIAVIGLIASVAAIMQRTQGIDMLYGVWRPIDTGARPFGPFVNRNHMATWITMACPLVFGYLLARAPRRDAPHLLSQRVVNALTQLGTVRIWLVVAVCMMTLTVMLSASRSGLIGLVAACMISAVLLRRRGNLVVRRWVFFQFVLLALVVLWFANYDVLLRRVDETVTQAQEGRGRVAIWRDTIRLMEDFPIAGTGAGTYGTAINVYQTAEPGYAIGEAHNHYLQLTAEGGAWLLLPTALAAGLFLVVAGRSLKQDVSANYLIRAGACAGMTGVLVQSIWETGLTLPANALLFAMLAAIATYSDERD